MKAKDLPTNELLFKYFDNTTDSIIIHNSENRIVYYNTSFSELSKFNMTEILGKSTEYFSLTINNLIQFVYKEHELTVNGNLVEKLLYETEYQNVSNGDECFHINKISLNISLKTQDKTHKSILRFAEEIPDSVVIINFEGKILYSNQKYPKVAQYLQQNIDAILDENINKVPDQTELEIIVDESTYLLTIAINQDLSLCNFYAKDISPRKWAEKMVVKSEDRFKKIAHVSGAYVWETDKNLNITYISELACDLHKKALTDFFGKSICEVAHEDDRESMKKFLERNIAVNSSFTDLHYRTLLPNNDIVWFYSSGSPLYDENGSVVGLSGVSLDFTKTRNQTINLSETYHQINRILSKMKSGIILVTTNNRIKHINRSFANLFNIKNMFDVLGSGLPSVLNTISQETKNPAEFISITLKQLEINKEVFGDIIEMKDGTYLERDFQPIYKEDTLEGYLWSYRNITDRINYEKQLEEAKKRAETATQLKSNFISNVSHEIRTPMNGIFGLLQILQSENPTEEQSKLMETLRFSANNLLEIINDLLDIHKIEAGKMNFDTLPFSLDEIIMNLKSTFEPIAVNKRLYLKFDIPSSIPKVFIGDPTRLGQILNNLVSNAFKFTSKGGIVIRLKYRCLDADKIQLYFKIEDTGIGIAKDKLTDIFTSFTQGELDKTHIYGGTGLGLSICKSLVEIMGGNIYVHSERGKGASFYFNIPFETTDIKLTSKNANIINEEDIKIISEKSVLLVEDNLVNQLIVRKIINTWGCKLTIANDGQEAVDIIKNDTSFDIILMDLKMPRMDGYEATSAIRSMKGEYYEFIPIVALTASAMRNEKSKLLNSGMNEHLIKPFQIEDLLNIMVKLLIENNFLR